MVTVLSGRWRLALLVLIACLPPLATAQDHQPEEAFIELSASDDELYVQQQLLLTVKLYYTNDVIQGNLSDPEHPDAVIEKLGEQKQYRELLNGERYRVVERAYVVFPQKPGRLQLPPVDFQGTARHPRGHQYRVADSAALFALNIKDIPETFSGRTWLPATDLELDASGPDTSGPVAPGANLTRTLTLTARGLPATTLPDLDHDYPDALRAYPEPAQRQATAAEDGVVGRLQQTVALVPVPGHSGEITLPEVRIRWWDVTEDREKVAVLPARTIELSGPVRSEEQAPERTDRADADEGEAAVQPAADGPHWLWPIVAAILTLGWLTTAVAWWLHSRSSPARPAAVAAGASDENQAFERLCQRASMLDPTFFNELPRWVRALTGNPCGTSDVALAVLDNAQLHQAVGQWREHLFRDSTRSAPDGGELVRALKTARKDWLKRHSKAAGTGGDLPPLYPEGLRP